MRLRSAALPVFLLALFAYAPLQAQTGAAGVLEIWLKAQESADAPNSEKVSLYLKSKALVIGNDGYDGRGWPTLSNGIRDAEEVAKGLAAQGFEVTLKKNLISSELDRTLRTFFILEGADPSTRLLVWFAGHGDTVDGEGYIVPVDAPSPKADAAFRDKAISLRRFGEYMREARARHVLAIFDSCFSGSVFNVARSAPPPAVTMATTQPVREFISSGDAEQQVSDDGTFRRLFLDALAGREPDADANHDGYVTGTELGLFLQQKMTNLTNNRQTPRYGKLNALGYDRGDFVFQIGAPPAPVNAPIASTLPMSEAAQAWAVTQNTTSVAVLEEFVRQFASTPYGPMARARLDELKKSQIATAPPATAPSPAPPSPPQQADRGWLGVRIQQVTDDLAETLNIKPPRGALVAGVDDRSPAKPAGIGIGDVIVRFDGKEIKDHRELARIVSETPAGTDVEVTIVRRGREENKTLKLGQFDEKQASLPTSNTSSVAPPDKAQSATRAECERLTSLSDAQLGPSVRKAIAACRQALDAFPGNADVMFRLGRAHRLDGNYAEAKRLFLQASDLGSSNAFIGLALMYRNGWGVAPDFREAARLFRKAVDLGNPVAMTDLGMMYANGNGVPRDLGEAEKLWRKAAELGDDTAKNNLSMMATPQRRR